MSSAQRRGRPCKAGGSGSGAVDEESADQPFPLLELPDQLICSILQLVPLRDRLHAAQACRRLRAAADAVPTPEVVLMGCDRLLDSLAAWLERHPRGVRCLRLMPQLSRQQAERYQEEYPYDYQEIAKLMAGPELVALASEAATAAGEGGTLEQLELILFNTADAGLSGQLGGSGLGSLQHDLTAREVLLEKRCLPASLRTLRLHWEEPRGVPRTVAAATQLRQLWLRNESICLPLDGIEHLTGLTSLRCDGFVPVDPGLLGELTSLRELLLCWSENYDIDARPAQRPDVHAVSASLARLAPSLTRFEYWRVNVESWPNAVAGLGHWTNLRALALHCEDEELPLEGAQLARLTRLTSLALRLEGEKAAPAIGALHAPHLHTLHVDTELGTSAEDAVPSAEALRRLPSLQVLSTVPDRLRCDVVQGPVGERLRAAGVRCVPSAPVTAARAGESIADLRDDQEVRCMAWLAQNVVHSHRRGLGVFPSDADGCPLPSEPPPTLDEL
ncbi:hypothetical protein ABPG75_003220 [Micractinium tetrahymenae]